MSRPLFPVALRLLHEVWRHFSARPQIHRRAALRHGVVPELAQENIGAPASGTASFLAMVNLLIR
jgi:hypothetical protein